MPDIDVQERACRVCQAPLQSVLDLGTLALSSFPDADVALDEAPLDFCRCSTCGLVQLRHTVSPDAMFRHYWYRSGINGMMRAELADVVADGVNHLGNLSKGDIVIDIGANDGTLLSFFPYGVTRIAYEPADNLRAALRGHCDELFGGYFPDEHVPDPGTVSLITSIACFYAVDDPLRFVSAVNDALSSRGLWIVQFQDLKQMLEATAFDDICHEHLFYPSLASIDRLLAPFDLAVLDAERRAINGGSLRMVIGRRWRYVSPRVASLRNAEDGCENTITLNAFAQRVVNVCAQIRTAIKNQPGIVDLYGASTKGNTLLQICGLGPDSIRQAWERSPEKWGRKTVTGIPIVSEERGRVSPPDLLFVGIWQFREAVVRRESAYLQNGGKFLFPLPKVEMVCENDVHEDFSSHSDASTTR